MKLVKAWAVVDANGDLSALRGCPCAYSDEETAKFCCAESWGERVVRVTIIVEDE